MAPNNPNYIVIQLCGLNPFPYEYYPNFQPTRWSEVMQEIKSEKVGREMKLISPRTFDMVVMGLRNRISVQQQTSNAANSFTINLQYSALGKLFEGLHYLCARMLYISNFKLNVNNDRVLNQSVCRVYCLTLLLTQRRIHVTSNIAA